MMERRPALGKGLSALIPDAPEPQRTARLALVGGYDLQYCGSQSTRATSATSEKGTG